MNYVKYLIKKTRIGLYEQLELSLDHALVEKVTFEESKNQKNWTATFLLNDNVLSVEEAESITKVLLEDILNIISYKFDGVFKDVFLEGTSIKGAINQANIRSMLTIKTSVSIALRNENAVRIKEALSDSTLTSSLRENPNQVMYREALKHDNVMLRFIYLYSILYEIKEKSQTKVDEYIRTHDIAVEERLSTNPRTPNRYETIYTWLRNQIGHTNKDSNLSDNEKMVESLIDEFSYIVKKAIQ